MTTREEYDAASFLWGYNYKNIYLDVYKLGRKSKKQVAEQVLNDLVHPELREILDYIEPKMEEGQRIIEYRPKFLSLLFGKFFKNYKKRFIFLDKSRKNGHRRCFAGLIEAAHLNYDWIDLNRKDFIFKKKFLDLDSEEIGKMFFIRI